MVKYMSQTFILLAISILTTVGANLCFKKGTLKLGELDFSFANFLTLFYRIFQNFWILGGIILFGISFILWLFVISRLQLNIAYPIAIGLQVTLIVIASWFLFKEYLSFFQILGIGLVILGIFLVLLKP